MYRFTASDRETQAFLKLLKIRAELMIDRTGAWECVEATTLLDRKTQSANEVGRIIGEALCSHAEGFWERI
jgi:hypothetical protein